MSLELTSQERSYLKSMTQRGLLTRWVACLLIVISIILTAVVLIDPNLVLGSVMTEPTAKKAALEYYFNNLSPQTELEKQLISANHQWNNFAWKFFLLTNVRFISIFSAYLLGLGVLTFVFSLIMTRVGRIAQNLGGE